MLHYFYCISHYFPKVTVPIKATALIDVTGLSDSYSSTPFEAFDMRYVEKVYKKDLNETKLMH